QGVRLRGIGKHSLWEIAIKPSKKKVLALCKRLGVEVKNLNGREQNVPSAVNHYSEVFALSLS
ncbi:hypothetical protein, partial [Cylindrospermopsis raciborskii]|uniref:hypothetical protein n=1 Tax=Cylindrospermopsis raciborskii TaxID=77022 RepID=UPI0011AF3480